MLYNESMDDAANDDAIEDDVVKQWSSSMLATLKVVGSKEHRMQSSPCHDELHLIALKSKLKSAIEVRHIYGNTT